MKQLFLKSLVLVSIVLVNCNTDSDMNIENFELNNELEIITQDEINDLLYLREEEKLARDVYLYSFDKYGLQAFNNIANSESKHMSSVLILINKYNLEDPASNTVGKFTNPDLQQVYTNLIAQSSISVLEALKVANKIEDMDIFDIVQNEGRTTKQDILQVYTSLKCGSRNHLRNFNSLLKQYNGTYTPEFISTDEFVTITSTTNEKCGNR